MFMKVLCCILMLASYVVVYIQIRLEDKWYYGAIYKAEKIRYERACKEEAMTRKEAIEILDEQHLTWTLKKAESYCVEVNEAIDMAIEALKDEPRSKVIAQINVDTDKIVKFIKRNCNREQAKGHWKSSDEVFGDGFEDAVCSLCRWESEYPVEYIRRRYKFCPHCGNKMVKEGEVNDETDTGKPE